MKCYADATLARLAANHLRLPALIQIPLTPIKWKMEVFSLDSWAYSSSALSYLWERRLQEALAGGAPPGGRCQGECALHHFVLYLERLEESATRSLGTQ